MVVIVMYIHALAQLAAESVLQRYSAILVADFCLTMAYSKKRQKLDSGFVKKKHVCDRGRKSPEDMKKSPEDMKNDDSNHVTIPSFSDLWRNNGVFKSKRLYTYAHKYPYRLWIRPNGLKFTKSYNKCIGIWLKARAMQIRGASASYSPLSECKCQVVLQKN